MKSSLYNVQIFKELHSDQLKKNQLFFGYYGLWVKVLLLINQCVSFLFSDYFDSLAFFPVRSTSAVLVLNALFNEIHRSLFPDIHLECYNFLQIYSYIYRPAPHCYLYSSRFCLSSINQAGCVLSSAASDRIK